MWRSLAPPPSSLASSSSLSGGTIGAMECRSSSRYICHLLVAKISQAHSHCCSGVAEPHFTLAWRRRGTRAGGNQSPKCSWMQGLQVGLRKEKKTYAWPIKYFVNIEYCRCGATLSTYFAEQSISGFRCYLWWQLNKKLWHVLISQLQFGARGMNFLVSGSH